MIRRRIKLLTAALLIPALWIAATGVLKQSRDRGRGQTLAIDDDVRARQGFSVYTGSCKIPEFEPWDPSIRPFVGRGSEVKCGGTWGGRDLTYVRDGVLYISNASAPVNAGVVPKYCAYKEVLRSKGLDDEYDYSTDVVQFTNSARIDKEFVKVTCYDGADERLPYSNFYAFVHLKDSVEQRCSDALRSQRHDGGKLNVLLVGLDSVSRYNFARQFPRTRRFLLDELGAFEMKGYTKVADNTFVNLMPLFTGSFAEEAGWSELKKEAFDDYPLAWRSYAKQGYRTLFAEDAPEIAIWNYMKEGFRNEPADYYYRPIALAMERDGMTSQMWNSDHDCFGARTETTILLDYVSAFVRQFRDEPHFAFTFLTRVTHSDINKQSDREHHQFLTRLHNDQLLNNTLIIYFSDHGMRYGPVVSTYMGKIEERMPAMLISLPKWFLRKYPLVGRNLRVNENRLSSPFDVHATLVDALGYGSAASGRSNDGGRNARSTSLFDEIPSSRTCTDSGILPHWCTCQLQRPVSPDDRRVRKAAESLLLSVNDLLKAAPQCVELRVESVLDALVAQNNDDVLQFKASLNDVVDRRVYFGPRAKNVLSTFMVTVRATPGEGVFVGTLQHDELNDEFEVKGEISRINAYGKQSHCVQQHSLKKFCYCRVQ